MRCLRKVVLAVFLVVILTTPTAFAGDRFLVVNGQETTVEVVDPGTARCIGGTATGDPFFPCVDSHRVFLRDQVVKTALISSSGEGADLLAGVATITVDCNLDGELRGNCWGTFEWEVDSESTWAGVVSGKFDYSTFVLDYSLVGNGFGGAVDGMHLRYDVYYDGGWDFIGDFAARIHTTKD